MSLVKTPFEYLEYYAAMVAQDSAGQTERGAFSQSLERGLAILSAFGREGSSLGIAELAREFALSRSTAHRYVATLAMLGYLEQDAATKKYRLGPRVIDLGLSAINSMEVREVSAPHLQQLSDETGYTVNLAVRDGLDIVYVDRCRNSRAGQREIDLNLHVGSRLPAYCTSMGKVLLAYLPREERDELLARVELTRRGPNTIVAKSELIAELQRIRQAGMAVNNEELAYGLRSIAAPIFDQDGRAAAALNLAVHSSMVSMEDLLARLSQPLRQTASAISTRLGHRPQEAQVTI